MAGTALTTGLAKTQQPLDGGGHGTRSPKVNDGPAPPAEGPPRDWAVQRVCEAGEHEGGGGGTRP